MQINNLDVNAIITFFGVTISLISLRFSLMSFKTAQNQFKLLNQGYLNVSPTLYFFTDDDVLHNDSIINGFEFRVRFENISHVGLKFNPRVIKLTFSNNEQINYADDEYVICYPKQEHLLVINPQIMLEMPVSYREFWKFNFAGTILVVYQDLVNNSLKTIDRSFKLMPEGTNIKVSFVLINDRL